MAKQTVRPRDIASRQSQIGDPERFGSALREGLAEAGWTQTDLAEELGSVTQSIVSHWCNAKLVPDPATVFLIEALLGFEAGGLSRLLGFLPLDAAPTPEVTTAIRADRGLRPADRTALVSVYRSMLRKR
ncbi:MAG: helix-turn-helix transcriptional regulator [Actinomycetes bacterium]